jgi:exodeoxyribonuclease VII large subunit
VTSSIVRVGELTTYLRDLIEETPDLQDIWVEGEVSAFTVAASGHAYFTIKDEQAAIDCVMWKMVRQRQSFQPRQGDKVYVHGAVSVYERNARLQVKADVIHPAGVGLLQLQLEQLRQKLEAEGMFDPSRKRPLPGFPRRIGVVTSSTGAVWHDIQRVIGRRYPLAHLVLAPAVVQGDRAVDSIVRALETIAASEVDIVILARGGGSAEDLWAFNDERIARAIFGSRIPVVSAIGHETDTTIADLVADVRASTPSVAAELATPDMDDLLAIVRDLRERATSLAIETILRGQRDLDTLSFRLNRGAPAERVAAMQVVATALTARLDQAARHVVERRGGDVAQAAAALHALDPQAVLRRGFAHLSLLGSTEPLRTVGDVTAGDQVSATLADGSVTAWVTNVTASPTLPTRGTS